MDKAYIEALRAGAAAPSGQSKFKFVNGQYIDPTPQAKAQPKKRNLLQSLIPAAGAIGAGLVAAPFTGGLSLAGTIAALGAAGAAGGALGEFGAQKVSGEAQDGFDKGNIFQEGLISGAFGAGGAGLAGIKGLRAAKAAGASGQYANDLASQVARGSLKAKNVANVVSGSDKGMSLASKGIGAFDKKGGIDTLTKATKRVNAAGEMGIQSGRKGLQQATNKISQLEKQLQPMLQGKFVKPTNVTSVIDDAINSSVADVGERSVKGLRNSAYKAVSNATKNGKVGMDEVRAYRSKLGQEIFKGVETESKTLKKDLYRALGDYMKSSVKGVDDIFKQQSSLMDIAPGLVSRSGPVNVPLPLVGGRIPIPGLAVARDRGIDLATKAAPFTSGIIPQATRQLLPRGIGASLQSPQPQDPMLDQTVQDPMMDTTTMTPDVMGGLDQTMQQDTQEPAPQYTLQQALSEAYQIAPNASESELLSYAKALMTQNKDQAEAAATATGGQQYNSTAAGVIADTTTGLQSLDNLRQSIGTNTANAPLVGQLRGLNPYDTKAQNLQSQIGVTRQIVGKALEGGVLRKEDEVKYAKILPKMGDTDEVAQAKIDQLIELISQRLELYKNSISGTGGTDLGSLIQQYQPTEGVYQ